MTFKKNSIVNGVYAKPVIEDISKLKPDEKEMYEQFKKFAEEDGENEADEYEEDTPINDGETETPGQSELPEKGRPGRHKTNCACEKCVAKRAAKAEQPQTPGQTEQPKKSAIDSVLGEYADVTPAPNTVAPNAPAAQPNVSKFITGRLFLLVIDALFPMLMLMVMKFIDPKYAHITDTARKKLKLTKEEKNELEEAANEVVKYLFADTDPRLVFLVGLGAIYYAKFDELGENDFEKPKRREVIEPPKKAPAKRK